MADTIITLKSMLLVSALLLQSCGGGEEQYAGIDRGGEKPDLSVTGPINGFGSVIVNGVRYNTDNAEIFVRGVPANEQELEVGNYVTVVGRINDAGEGIALEVHYQPKVTGPIEWINPQRNRISVLGQVVQLVQDTHYGSSIRPRNIEALSEGQRISVSGIAAADQVIRASRVELEPAVESEVAGMISRLDPVEQTFYLNELRVEYAFAPIATLGERQPVVVRGALDGHTFKAQSISFDTDYRKLKDIPSIEFRGYVSQLRDEYFYVDGMPARLMATTVFSEGVAEDLKDNSQVRARGRFDEDFILQVERLEFVSAPVMQSFGIIESFESAEPGSKYQGSVTVSGFTYKLQAETRLEGDAEQRISFADLRRGDSVYVSAFNEGKTLIAASLVVANHDTYTMSFEFQGAVHAIDYCTRQFSIFNRRIQTSADTRFSEEGTPLTEEEFFGDMVDKSVRVRGYLEDGLLIATSAQISTNAFFDGYSAFNAYGGDCLESEDVDTVSP